MLKQDDTGDVERGHCIETFFECDAAPPKNYETLFDSKAFLFLHLLQLEPTFASFIWILLPSNEVFNFILPEVAWRLGPEPELFA